MHSEIVRQLENLCSPRRKAKLGVGLPNVSEILRREEVIQNIAVIMKQEFVGLDTQIDHILSLVRPWYVMPQAQRRPTVISLWGMTGVGKSSFVTRLVDLLQMKASYGYVDLGKAADKSMVRMDSASPFPAVVLRLSGGPGVIFFDEMHSVRTVDEMGHDIDRPQLCDFWTMIDSGIVAQSFDVFTHALNRCVQDLRSHAKNALDLDYFADEFTLDNLITLLELKTTSRELREIAVQDVPGFLNWTIKQLEQGIRDLQPLDFTQCLVFTAGNLDEVYGESYSLNPDDMNAEDLFFRTSQVGPDKVKQSLLRRFRPEQVARLGSMQIVFPSLSKSAFLSLIRIRLKDLSSWVYKNFQVRLKFDESVVQLILHEGVIPAQGARPVLSTITELIEIRTATWLIAASRGSHHHLLISFEKMQQHLQCYAGHEIVHSARIELREDRLPEISVSPVLAQSILVHESGHAVVGIVTQGMLPVKILTGSMAWHRGGPRVEFRAPEMMTKASAMDVITMLLGGMAAEQVMFGSDQFSTGASTDLQKATELAGLLVTQCGMGDHLSVSVGSDRYPANTTTHKESDDQQIEKILQTALRKARQILREQKDLLQALVSEMRTNSRMTPLDVAEVVRKYYRGSQKDIDSILRRTSAQGLEKLAVRPQKPRSRKAA